MADKKSGEWFFEPNFVYVHVYIHIYEYVSMYSSGVYKPIRSAASISLEVLGLLCIINSDSDSNSNGNSNRTSNSYTKSSSSCRSSK